MNEADPSPINLDELRLLPAWLREEGPPPSKQYATHEGGAADEAGSRRGGSRPGGFSRDRPSFGGGGGGGGGGGDRRREGPRRSGPPPRGGNMGRPPRDERRPAPEAPTMPAPVRVEFLPDEKCLVSITKQIRATHMAYPLFGLARMFLQEPARHLVQFTLLAEVPAGTALYQLGEDGPITLDRTVLERIAFDASKEKYYTEQSEQKDPPKGNFSNVARNRLSGALLGPTNYHGYQPALRAEYESSFSRRMSFEDYRRNIEVVTDPALVERWKEEARTTTSIITREGEPPTTLQSESDARAHFRQHHLDTLVRTGTSFTVHGSVARTLPEPAMMQAIRHAHDTELRYPAQFVQLLRQGLQNAGLHIFKHRKRVVYVSLARPTSFSPDGVVTESVAAILDTVAKNPLCTRKVLADHVLAGKAGIEVKPVAAPTVPTSTPPEAVADESVTADEPPPATEATLVTESAVPAEASVPVAAQPAPTPNDPLAKAKAGLAADLRFLVQSGHLIEFHNGTFDLPLPPKPKDEPSAQPARAGKMDPVKPAEAAEPLPAATVDDPVAVEAERADLTLDSVTIVPPDAPPEGEAASALESGLEHTGAPTIAPPGPADGPGIASADQHGAAPDPVVIGDMASAHPLSPL